MLVGGVLVGLLAVGVGGLWGGAGESDLRKAEAPDYWAESRRSREILETQEGPPAPAGKGVTHVGAASAVTVVDGGTLQLGGEIIRIADIDTPEVQGRCAYETELADRATRRMAALLAAGPFELHRAAQDEDSDGRKLRIATRGGHSLGEQLVAEGLARAWSGQRTSWCG